MTAPPLDWWNVEWEQAVDRLVRSMVPGRVCLTCGEPSRRIVESERISTTGDRITVDMTGSDRSKGKRQNYSSRVHEFSESNFRFSHNQRTDHGFSDCGHDDWRPGVVLDPFGGSGTTALVATGHGRDCILIDLDERNYDLALDRVGPLVLTLAGREELEAG